MSQFSKLDITFNKGERFRTITLDADHESYAWSTTVGDFDNPDFVDHSGLWEVFNRFVDCGWEMVSVVVDGSTFQYEALRDLSRPIDVVELFDALKEERVDAHTICAWLTVDETANLANLEDSVHAEGSSLETLFDSVMEYEDVNHGWLVVDKEASAEAYAEYYGYELVEFEGWYYLFNLNY